MDKSSKFNVLFINLPACFANDFFPQPTFQLFVLLNFLIVTIIFTFQIHIHWNIITIRTLPKSNWLKLALLGNLTKWSNSATLLPPVSLLLCPSLCLILVAFYHNTSTAKVSSTKSDKNSAFTKLELASYFLHHFIYWRFL